MSSYFKAMIVDPDCVKRATLMEALEAVQFECRAASTGPEAVAALGDDPADLLMVDLVLEDGGDESCISAALELATPPLVMATSTRVDLKLAKRALNNGALEVFYRPLDLSLLSKRARLLVERRAQTNEPSGVADS